MERKTGFAVAGAVAMILVGGAIAAGANLGLLGFAKSNSPVGHLKPAAAAVVTTGNPNPQVVTVEVQESGRSATAKVVGQTGEASNPTVRIQSVPPPSGPGVTSAALSVPYEHETAAPSSDGRTADD
jgi:hypothetical protein